MLLCYFHNCHLSIAKVLSTVLAEKTDQYKSLNNMHFLWSEAQWARAGPRIETAALLTGNISLLLELLWALERSNYRGSRLLIKVTDILLMQPENGFSSRLVPHQHGEFTLL